MIYYIDNEISELRKSDLEKNEIFHRLPSELNVINDEDCIIINCEINIDKDDNSIERSSFYGIKFVQELRKKNHKGKVLFCSFLTTKQLINQNESSHSILQFPGHGFIQFPKNGDNLKTELEKIEKMDELTLMDCKYHFCDLSGYINEELHTLRNLANSDNFEEYAFTIISNIERDLGQNLDQIKSFITNGNHENIEKLNFLNNKLDDLLNASQKINNDESNKPYWRWEILWLDDEIEENNLLKARLENIGIKVHLVRNYWEAKNVWYQDYYLNAITLVIADYRLKENGEIKGKQGYQFLKEVGDSGTGLGLVAYSALPRKFMLDSLKHYGLYVNSYSKFDFNVDNQEHVSFLIDSLVYLGDLSWELIHNQPTGDIWDKRKKAYFKFRNSFEFHDFQSKISNEVKEYVDDFANFYNSIGNKIGDVVIKKEDLYSVYKLPCYLKDLPTNIAIGKNQTSTEGIKKYLFFRRVIIGIYGFLKSNYNKNKFFTSDEYMTLLRVTMRRASLEEEKLQKVHDINKFIKNANNTTKQTFSALSLKLETTWPNNLFIEEKKWLIDLGYLKFEYNQELIKKKEKFILIISKKIQESFINSSSLQSLLSEDDEILSNKKIIIKTSSLYDDEESDLLNIYFTKDFFPCIKNIYELKIFIKEIVGRLGVDLEYNEDNFSEIIKIWRYVLSVSSDNFHLSLDKEISTINFFLKSLKTKYSKNKFIIYKHYWKEFSKKKIIEEQYFTIEDEYILTFQPLQILYKKTNRYSRYFVESFENLKFVVDNYKSQNFSNPKEVEEFNSLFISKISDDYINKYLKKDIFKNLLVELRDTDADNEKVYETIVKRYIFPKKEIDEDNYQTVSIDNFKNHEKDKKDEKDDESDSNELDSSSLNEMKSSEESEIEINKAYNKFDIENLISLFEDIFDEVKKMQIINFVMSKILNATSESLLKNIESIQIKKIDDSLLKILRDFNLSNYKDGYLINYNCLSISEDDFTFNCDYKIIYINKNSSPLLVLSKDFISM